jgi:hypothetical protein
MQRDPFLPQGEQVLGRCHPHPVSTLARGLPGLVSLIIGVGIAGVGLRLRQDGEALTGWEVPVAQLAGPLIEHTTLLGLIFIGLGCAIGGLAWLGWRTTEYLVTGPADPLLPGGHLIRVAGLLRMSWRSIPLQQVNDLGVDLPIWSRVPGLQRLFDWGTLHVIEGNDRDVQMLPYVPHAAAFYQLCQQRRVYGAASRAGLGQVPAAPGTPPTWFGNPQ